MTAAGGEPTASSGTGPAGGSLLTSGSRKDILCLFTCVGSKTKSCWCLLPHGCWAKAREQPASLNRYTKHPDSLLVPRSLCSDPRFAVHVAVDLLRAGSVLPARRSSAGPGIAVLLGHAAQSCPEPLSPRGWHPLPRETRDLLQPHVPAGGEGTWYRAWMCGWEQETLWWLHP